MNLEECLCYCHVGFAGFKPPFNHITPCCRDCDGCEKHIQFIHFENHINNCELYKLHLKYKEKYGNDFDKSYNKYLRKILKNKS